MVIFEKTLSLEFPPPVATYRPKMSLNALMLMNITYCLIIIKLMCQGLFFYISVGTNKMFFYNKNIQKVQILKGRDC